MLTVNKFMCHIELFVGCCIIGLINSVLSLIFAAYTILDMYNEQGGKKLRYKRVAVYDGHGKGGSGLFNRVLFVVYSLHFVCCIYLIAAASKKSTKYIIKYLLVSICTTLAAFIDGSLLVFSHGFTEMAVNYYAFMAWNIYFIICVYSYYKKYKERSQDEYGDAIEAQVMNV